LIEAAAAFVAWLGASLIVLADGRRGLALAIAVAAAGIAVLALQGPGPIAASAIAVGGAAAAARRLWSGPAGWEIMPPGSTPRLLLCIAVPLVALWVALSITAGPGQALRFTVLSVATLTAARVLWNDDPSVLVSATAVLALAVAAGTGLGASSTDGWPYVAGALVAAAIVWVTPRTPRAA
jgi:hypothetical protein